MKLIKQLTVLFLATIWATLAGAQSTMEFTAAHLEAAERVVVAMALPERFIIPTKQMLQVSLDRDPENAALITETMQPFLEKKYTANELKIFFARQFDLPTCREIATFWEGPVGKKLVRTQVEMLTTGEASPLVFTTKERAIMKRFDDTKAGQAFLVAMPGIEEHFAEYTKATQMKMRERFLQELEKKAREESPVSKTLFQVKP